MIMNQKINLKKKIGTNPNYPSQFIYAEPKEIDCYFERMRRYVRNQQGTQVTSEATVFTRETIAYGDVLEIDGKYWPVLAINDSRNIFGTLDFLDVAL